jgi:phasin family protein
MLRRNITPQFPGEYAMTNEVLSQLTANRDKLLAPVVKLNKLTVAKVEELAHFELAILREYTELSLGQLKAAVEVSDAESLKAFAESQAAVLKSVSEKVVKDAKTVTELGESFRNEAVQIAREGAAELSVQPV